MEDDSEGCTESHAEVCIGEHCTEECTGDDTESCCTEGREGIVYDAFLGRDLFIFGRFPFWVGLGRHI